MPDRRRRQRRRVGDVVVVPLSDDRLGFAWVLDEPLMAFFDLIAREEPTVEEIVRRPVLFRIWVMNYAVTRGIWPVLGHAELSTELRESPWFFKQDPINQRLSITRSGGEETPADLATCQRLECAAVWDPEHVASRLEDHFAGRPNRIVASLRPR